MALHITDVIALVDCLKCLMLICPLNDNRASDLRLICPLKLNNSRLIVFRRVAQSIIKPSLLFELRTIDYTIDCKVFCANHDLLCSFIHPLTTMFLAINCCPNLNPFILWLMLFTALLGKMLTKLGV